MIIICKYFVFVKFAKVRQNLYGMWCDGRFRWCFLLAFGLDCALHYAIVVSAEIM
jgi:hypothetical protein